MSELYAAVPCLAACVLWFHARKHRLSIMTTVGVALLVGLASITRQFSVLVLPCLYASFLLSAAPSELIKRLKENGPALLAGALGLGVVLALHAVWAQHTGNVHENFKGPLTQMMQFQTKSFAIFWAVAVIYVSLFCAPLLILIPGRGPRTFGTETVYWMIRRIIGVGYVICLFWFVCAMAQKFPAKAIAERTLNKTFPYFGNVIRNAGIGPLTLTDAYYGERLSDRPWLGPSWTLGVWSGVLVVGVLLSLRWWRVLRPAFPERTEGLCREVKIFGLALAFSSGFVVTQAFKFQVFDRYLFLSWVGLVIALSACLTTLDEKRGSKFIYIVPGCLITLLACFSVGGIYDQFRLHEARWAIFKEAKRLDIPPHWIDGGYEINGWNSFENPSPAHRNDHRLISQQCPNIWFFCQEPKFRIGVRPPVAGTLVLLSKRAHSLLGEDPTVYLLAGGHE